MGSQKEPSDASRIGALQVEEVRLGATAMIRRGPIAYAFSIISAAAVLVIVLGLRQPGGVQVAAAGRQAPEPTAPVQGPGSVIAAEQGTLAGALATETATLPPATPTTTPVATSTATSTAAPTTTPTGTPTSPPAPTATSAPAFLPAQSAVALGGLRHEWQTWNNCGPATLAMYLSYYGSGLNQADIRAVLRPDPDDKNVSPHELVSYAQSQGYAATLLVNGNRELLRTLLSNGIPAILETWHEAEPGNGLGHYRLVVGYDESRQEWNFYDSYDARGLIDPNVYAGIRLADTQLAPWWKVFNRTLILVYPPAQSELVNAILAATYGNPATMWQAARSQAESELAAAPDDAFAWFNLGSSLNALGHYGDAAAAFDQARTLGLPWRMHWYQFGPFESYLAVGRIDDVVALTDEVLEKTESIEEIYYWRGRALAAAGDGDGAQAAFARALALNPDYTPAAEMLSSLPG